MNEEEEEVSKLIDYYELLGVDKDASFESVHSAYRKLARECHPDGTNRRRKRRKIPGMEVSGKHEETLGEEKERKMFQLLCRAKEILTDEEKRIAYNVKLLGDERSKWRGSEAREFEDSFYHDMQTNTSKGHAEKPPPIVVRSRISLAEWMRGRDGRNPFFSPNLSIKYDKQTMCNICHGYQSVPYQDPLEGKNDIFRRYLIDWDPLKYTIECPGCTGYGFTLKDSSVQSKNRNIKDGESFPEGKKINHSTPEGYSTTITAEILSCSQCKGRKRIFASSTMVEECHECEGTGTRFEKNVSLDVPCPRHFDAETMTSVLVLLREGHQFRANQMPGDVHVIFELQIPKSTMVLRESLLPCKTPEIPSPSHEFSAASGNREEDEDEVSVPTSQQPSQEVSEVSEVLENDDVEEIPEIITRVPMDLKVSKDGKHFDVCCSINLRQAICGFSMEIPSYWTQGVALPVDCDAELCSTLLYMPRGAYTWTGDVWNKEDIGPAPCDLCSAPPFLWPSKTKTLNGVFMGKIFGRYPGFAPCLFVSPSLRKEASGKGKEAYEKGKKGKGSSTKKWVVHGCRVSRQRYPTHPGTTHFCLHRPATPRDLGQKQEDENRQGALRITFDVAAPVLPSPEKDHPDMFYRTFAWCCGKLEAERPPTVYNCS
jgi:DnaJ-class molecular chaperone